MVMYIFSSKLNSAFSTIGKATADKITAKLVGKTHACRAFAFAWSWRVVQQISLCDFEHFCAFR